MSRKYFRYIHGLLPLLLLIVVVSEQSGTHVSTNVQSTGNSQVDVHTEVNSSGSESSVYKKVEVDVDGVQKVYESTDQGSEEIKVTSDENGVEVKVNKDPVKKVDVKSEVEETTKVEVEKTLKDAKEDLPYDFTYSSIQEYIVNAVKDFFKSLLS